MRASSSSLPVLLIASLISGVMTFGLSSEDLDEMRAILWGRDAAPPAVTGEYTPLIERPSGAGMGNGFAASQTESDVRSAVDVPRGSPDRTALLDAIRPYAQREFGGPVEFVVLVLKRRGSEAFASVIPQGPGGSWVNCGERNCRSNQRMDADLKLQNGTWRVTSVRFEQRPSSGPGEPQYPDQPESRAVAPIPAPASPVRREPTVLQRPSSSRISQAYPAKAERVRVQGASGYGHQMNGYALIRCQVQPTGRLDSCTIVEENPLGFGFGAAALGLASEYRFSPATLNGEPVEGWAQIPIEWIGNQ